MSHSQNSEPQQQHCLHDSVQQFWESVCPCLTMVRLHAVGFCGVDDSVNLEELRALSSAYPWIEWGVLLRPDRQGQPRYASTKVLQQLGALAGAVGSTEATENPIRLAAHFCGDECLEALKGNTTHVRELWEKLGFRRLQLNPTAANAAGGWVAEDAADGIRAVAAALPEVEVILQFNEETKPLATLLFEVDAQPPPANLAALLDASCGAGVVAEVHPAPLPGVRCGYAGGISPATASKQLQAVVATCEGHTGSTWIDMESGVRSKNDEGHDVFDLERVRQVIDIVLASGVPVG